MLPIVPLQNRPVQTSMETRMDARKIRLGLTLRLIAYSPPIYRLSNARELGIGTDDYIEARQELELRGFVSCSGEITQEGRDYLTSSVGMTDKRRFSALTTFTTVKNSGLPFSLKAR